jgi:hypothetical protein
VLHVPNLTTPEHLMVILKETGAFSQHDLANIAKNIQGHK